ncbi:MAG TPA: hypothetical protein VN939_21255 [Chthoniobacterales bacterium]|nr:hypothetical protein [Chthoniobacterales bacterium]
MSITKHVLVLLFLLVSIRRLLGQQTFKPSITSWAPSSVRDIAKNRDFTALRF